MGYTTEFEGCFYLNHQLQENHRLYLARFSETRRMVRRPQVAAKFMDTIRTAANLPIGIQAEYFVGGFGFAGQDKDVSVIDQNRPPKSQPGLWCQWEPNENGTAIVWNGAEKFYEYVEWLEYIQGRFLKKWRYILDGSCIWQGEDPKDYGTIAIYEGKIKIQQRERIVMPRRPGYGEKALLSKDDKKPILLYTGDVYDTINDVCRELAILARPDLIDEYRERIRDVDLEAFFEITSHYAILEEKL